MKTVTLTRSGVELETPVLALGSNERMVLQFDILADEAENLTYSIFHCDADWRRDDLEPYEFMTGFESGNIENIEFSFGTLQSYVHYHQVVPAKFATFTHSGNYGLAVTNEAGDTLLTRRFWVSEQSVIVEITVDRPYDGMEVMKRQEVDVKIKNEELRMTFNKTFLIFNSSFFIHKPLFMAYFLLVYAQALLVEEHSWNPSFERIFHNGNRFEAVAFYEAFGEGGELVCVKHQFLELLQVAKFGGNCP